VTAATAATKAASGTAATASVTAATTATTCECRSWLNQADRCQCEQGYNRFPHHVFPPLDEVARRHTTLSQRDYPGNRRTFAVN
jgi:hypothetical protein